MESGMSHGNESLELDMGYGDGDSTDYGLDLDVEPNGGEDEQEMLMNSMTGELVGSEAGPNEEPYEGMEFETEEDGWMFYNTYARRMGFTTRISIYHRSRRDGSITSRQFVCAKEGFRTTRGKKDAGSDGKGKWLRAITRVGCKAMIRVRKQENGKWVVSKFQKVHNHALASQSRVHCIRSHRLLSESAKGMVGDFPGAILEQGIDTIPAFRDESQEIMDFGYANGDHISYTGVGQPTAIGKETQDIIEYFKRMQSEDSDFFYAVQFDDDQCMGNVFWADARSRMAYKYFGDAVTFDTSYKANQYQIPLAIFSGVNHHRQPVLFGCALLLDDSLSSLVWLFKTLLKAMSEFHPTSIISDQDKFIQAALAQIFPETRHHLCKWHILKEGQDKLSHVYRSYPSFQGEFQNCINMSETIEEFESCWWMLIARYNLQENEWLQSVYRLRHQWVPVYLRDTFFPEVSTAQRCESRSTFFEGYVNAQTPSQMFIHQYEKALDSRYEKEVKADFDTIYTLPHLKTPSPMEKQAAELYTRKLFMKFQEEFIETFVYTANKINEEGEISTYKVAKFEEEHKAYIVTFNSSETKATCSCQLFEHSGILCRHILTVFSVTSVLTLPPHYILKRWTINAKKEEMNEPNSKVVLDETNPEPKNNGRDSQESLSWRYSSLCREAIKFAEDGAISIDIYNVAIRALQEAVKKVTAAKKNVGNTGQPGALANGIGHEKQLTEAQKAKEKGLQDPQVSKEVREAINPHCLNELGHSLPSQVVQLIPSQVSRQTMTPQEVLLYQQPFNFVLFAPGLSSESGVPNLPNAAAPWALNLPNGQGLSTPLHIPPPASSTQGVNMPIPLPAQKQLLPVAVSPGVFDGNGPVLISLPAGNPNGDPKHGSVSLPPQRVNLVGMSHSSPNPGSGGNSASSAPSEPQLVAVPMAFYLPMMGNIPVACSGSSNPSASASSPGLLATPADSLQLSFLPSDAIARYSIAMSSQGSLISPSVPLATGSTNPVHVAAIAAGARLGSPSTAASSIKLAQSRNIARRRSRRGSSTNKTTLAGLKPLAPKLCDSQPPSTRYAYTGQNLPQPVSSDVIPDASQTGNQQIQGSSSGQAALTAEVVMLDGSATTPKELDQVQAGNSARPAPSMAEMEAMDDSGNVPRDPDLAQGTGSDV